MKISGLSRTGFSLFAAVFLAGCAAVSFDEPKPHSDVITDTANTTLGRNVGSWVAEHDGLSGFYPLSQGMDALGVRLRLAERAERSIDLQYFLAKNDTAGMVFANALLKAADRGVRIRFLLDDVFTTAPDRALLLLDQHPNIEVRLFNPISRSGSYRLNYLFSFRRANRRMHNKSFTVDNVASVVGGRNIADEYFQLRNDNVFLDFDVLAIGPIVNEISGSFNQYWNHSRAVPIDQIAGSRKAGTLDEVRKDIAHRFDEAYDTVYSRALESPLLQNLIADRQQLFAADAEVLSDQPDKLTSKMTEEHMQLANHLREVLLSARKELILISPYYVPGKSGVQFLRGLTDHGVRTIIATNSLASNNHVPVHSAYAHYRKDVIRAGAKLYEARADAARAISGSESGPDTLTLHTKLYLIDRRYLFVGSPNLDPRSIVINAEMGLLIDSPEMVAAIAERVEQRLSEIAYRVVLNERGKLEWHADIDGIQTVETREPQTSGWLRFKAWFLKIVPDSQL